MARQIYALLVGIDQYPRPVSPLKGCVNDVVAMADYLQGRVAQEGYQLHVLTLKDQEATRQAIIDGFRNHLCQAGSEDVAFFYYSGHGSQAVAPPEFWHLEPDRLNETLVCWDSRTEGGWDLADKELAKLIAEVAANNPHTVMIMDCCHSGSGTRDPLLATAVRRIPTDWRQRPLSSFLVSPAEAEQLSDRTRSPEGTPTGWTLPQGRHILLAACRDNEEAKEYYGNGQPRGTFCFFLLETLKQANGSLTYRDLFKRTNALVRSKVTAQSPQLEATHSSDLDQPFLGGAIAPRTPYFTISYDRERGWVMDGGAVHGVAPVTQGETTHLAVFPFDSTPEQLRQLSHAIGTAEVTEVSPQLSRVAIAGIPNLTAEMTFKAVVTALPLPPMGVWLEGEAEGLQLVRRALQIAELGEQPSLYVREVSEVGQADFHLLAQAGEYWITRPADDRPLVAQVSGYSLDQAVKVVKQLEHMARWTTISALASPATSRISADAVQLQIYQGDQVLEASQIRLEYSLENGQWKQPTFMVRLHNTSDEPLYCALLDLTERYAVTAGLFEAGGVWLNPGEEAWSLGKRPIYASVPKELWDQGITEYKDVIKLIVSTAEFDARLLEQESLNLPRTQTIKRSEGGRRSTLNRLMNRVQTRDLSSRPEDEEFQDDWVTSQVTITTVRPLHTTPVSPERGVPLGHGVTLQPHPNLQAQVRLTTVSQSTRDLGNFILPPLLRTDSPVTQPFQFTTSRGTDPGLSALELSRVDASTIATVTPTNPLTLVVDASLAEGERILPIAFDGEFFLPLGIGQTQQGKTEIRLERLPEPVSEGKRSLGGSIRIFFQKVLSQKLALEFPYPILAAVDVSQDEVVGYTGELEQVRTRVAQADRIVLFIHGIIGDTQTMVPSVQRATVEANGQSRAIATYYDLVLGFDYENLNTSIEENARKLKQRLEAVGLGPNHGKTLHIVAHSMGGLVSRWLIEREGGNQMVQHLIMLGTPNGGSPWPTVQVWVTTALGIGLNSLATISWPVPVLGPLLTALGSGVGAIETFDVSLDQMQAGSPLLESLAASQDPGIPYTIIAGNTSIVAAALQPDPGQTTNPLERLMQKLFNTAVALPFFGQPNDIAVTVTSIKNVSLTRTPKPEIEEVGCDHLVYFINQTGLQALAGAIARINAIAPSPTSPEPPSAASAISPEANPVESSPQVSEPEQRRQPGWLTGLVIGILGMGVAIAGYWWQQSQKQQPAHQTKTSAVIQVRLSSRWDKFE